MEEVSLKALLEAGCHFGHKADRWNPKAQKFIYQERDGIHIIDLVKTKALLEAAAEFIKAEALEGKTVLFCGTKRQAASTIKTEAVAVGAPYISERWIGGFMTNWEQVHQNLEKIRRLKEEEQTGAWKKFPKHERVKLARYVRKLEHLYGGVIELRQIPDILFVVDIRREEIACNEAYKMEVPVVALVDTNSDPTFVDYPIPANDDAVGSINYIVHYLAEAYREGKQEREKKEAKKAETAEKKQGAEGEKQIEEKVEEVGKVVKADKVEKREAVEVFDKPKKKRGRPKKQLSNNPILI